MLRGQEEGFPGCDGMTVLGKSRKRAGKEWGRCGGPGIDQAEKF